jgi:AcrR family transcriptional regulator
MPARKKLTRPQLQATALAIVDEQGLQALTMRSLAAALGSAAMTIYNYVDGKEGLERLVTEAVMSEATWDDVPTDWQAEATAIAVGMWRAVQAHPNAIPLILTRRLDSAATLASAEALLDALSRSGRSGPELFTAFRLVTVYISGSAQTELARPDAPVPDDFPRLAALATTPLSAPEAEFRAGLAIILTGLGG